MIHTDYKIINMTVHHDIDGIPKRKQHNHTINLVIKSKSIKRCMEIYDMVLGHRESKFTKYHREHGCNQSHNSKYMELTNDYEECVMYSVNNIGWDFILFEIFKNKLRSKTIEKVFDLKVSEYLQNILDNGINNKLLEE